MTKVAEKKTAFFSLNDTRYAIKFAKLLKKKNWNIIATEETYSILRYNNIKSVSLNKYVNFKKKLKFPPTLHPEIENSLVSEKKIDLAYILTYPISKGIDIGGHTIIALAIKGERIIISNNNDLFKYMSNIKKFGKVKKRIVESFTQNSKKKILRFYEKIYKK